MGVHQLRFLTVYVYVMSRTPIVRDLAVLRRRGLAAKVDSLLSSLRDGHISATRRFQFRSVFFKCGIREDVQDGHGAQANEGRSTGANQRSSVYHYFARGWVDRAFLGIIAENVDRCRDLDGQCDPLCLWRQLDQHVRCVCREEFQDGLNRGQLVKDGTLLYRDGSGAPMNDGEIARLLLLNFQLVFARLGANG